ncbi:MAG TPA: zinc ribbon domain-containing protein [Firmicutes bacterium]|uniref:Zinc ribbon domain-containing protein n=1 Tax=Capillibacterium thermochitinicola TaxID=2699427 RepID=A0A8J6I2Y6_9FIRM|nr:zinc ribbon domain-containing protein [Capillibacterium thermochitinicola]MBA2133297.1 zinc ribbon domain-containing protein [Capillibacterium thermochitinicola]HHW12465.1 zinc ribbon domain-containing protein [Bacillota bacterium]
MDTTAIVLFIIKLVLTGGLMFVLYRDARARDYTWFMWTFTPIIAVFTAGFTGSIMTLLLILVLYRLTRPKGDLLKCPHCGKKIHNVLAFCPYCRQSVKRECLRCHDTVDWDAERCPHCGSMNLTKF